VLPPEHALVLADESSPYQMLGSFQATNAAVAMRERIAERFIDAGDRVVVIAEWRGRGKTSGVFTNLRYGTVLTLREAKITSMISYTDPAEALEAAGLRE